MSQYLGRGLILTPMTFSAGGRSLTAPVIVDSGAEGFAAIDKPFAEKLGIDLRLSGLSYGVGGSTLAWTGRADELKLKDVPDCAVQNVNVSVSDIPLLRPNAVALLGLNFMGNSGMTIKFAPGAVKMGCVEGGAEVTIPVSPLRPPTGDDASLLSPVTVILIGVGALAVIGLLAYLVAS